MSEHDALERKSLRLVTGPSPDWDAVARACVCFANGRGGILEIGVEDGDDLPPSEQRIPPELPDRLFARIGERTRNVAPEYPRIEISANGGERLVVRVASSQGVACTTKGLYYVRVADACKPVEPEDLGRLFTEKGAMVWETMVTDVPLADADPSLVRALLDGLRGSDRVKPSVKARTDAEILAGYDLTAGDRLTHLGVLWLGRRSHRARLRHAPVIFFIRYDARGQKVSKVAFGDDHEGSPWDLLDGVASLPVWDESLEVPAGIFREHVPIYDVELVRELVANALVHRLYTTAGDVFVCLYADRLEVHSPGPLPVGVTPRNILHVRKRRNEAMARLFHDLHLMEGEGTGFDRMYDLLLSSGRPAPEVVEGPDRVEVTVRGLDADRQAVRVVAEASKHAPLTERERIVIGLLARRGPLRRAELARALSLEGASSVGPWVGSLVERKLVLVVGQTAGQRLKVNPRLLQQAGARVRTSLADIENHRLLELLRTDLAQFPDSAISDIIRRVGPEIPRHQIKRQLQVLRTRGTVEMAGERSTARYRLVSHG